MMLRKLLQNVITASSAVLPSKSGLTGIGKLLKIDVIIGHKLNAYKTLSPSLHY